MKRQIKTALTLEMRREESTSGRGVTGRSDDSLFGYRYDQSAPEVTLLRREIQDESDHIQYEESTELHVSALIRLRRGGQSLHKIQCTFPQDQVPDRCLLLNFTAPYPVICHGDTNHYPFREHNGYMCHHTN